MKTPWSLPWVGLVLALPAVAAAQTTVGEDTAGTPNLERAIRSRQTVTLGGGERGHAQIVPEYHTVVRGDTLWDISGYYFENPWRWPMVWSRNPQITNPHWIFPGDQVRLLLPGEIGVATAGTGTTLGSAPIRGAAHRLALTRSAFPRGTAFHSEEAWVAPEDVQAAGTIVGAPEDAMLLSEGNQVYISFQRAPQIGSRYTIYQDAQEADSPDRGNGHVVRVLGTAEIDSWDASRKVATAHIIESIDPIERGERVALLNRQFAPVPPRTNDRNVSAHIVATTYPREMVGGQYIIHIDRGTDDGVQLGNRLFVMRRGDPWRNTLQSLGRRARNVPMDRDGDGIVDQPPDSDRAPDSLPAEAVGEAMVVGVHRRSASCLVTLSNVEIEVGMPVVLRRGY